MKNIAVQFNLSTNLVSDKVDFDYWSLVGIYLINHVKFAIMYLKAIFMCLC